MISEVSDMKVHPVRGLEGAMGDVSTNALSGLAVVTVDPDEYPSGHAVTVPGLASLAPLVRAYLRASVDLLPTETVDLVELLGAELFTNAVRHSRSGDLGGLVTVLVHSLPDRVQVRVVDAGPRDGQPSGPFLRPIDLDREGGLGMHLVATEASRWGTVYQRGHTSAWFDIDHAKTPSAQPVRRIR